MRRVLFTVLILTVATIASGQRLPRNFIPTDYDLTITPDFSTDRFAGEETIRVLVQRPVRELVLNAAEIEFASASIKAGGVNQNATVASSAEAETATLTFPEPVAVGEAEVRITYKGILNGQLRGLYLGEANGKKYAATQFESVDARRAFPCFDEPDLKASFRITIIADKNHMAISNSPVESDTPGPIEGKHTIRFAPTPRISTYLVAMTIGDLSCLSDSVDGTPLRVCASPDKAPLGKYALEATKSIVHYYNTYYSIPYPFAKLDQIGIPDFRAGAMENVGSIIYRETALLNDEATGSGAAKRSISGTIAHEIGHMWFGDLVTTKWWDDIWLNEGFATWVSQKAVANWKPEWNIRLSEVQSASMPIGVDVLEATRPIHNKADTPSEIEQAFDGIAYGKTAAMLRMVESYVGEEKFREGINLYLRRNSWSNASAGDFSAAIADASNQQAADIIQSYIKQPGIPLVTMESHCDQGETVLSLKQQRFYANRKKIGTSSQTWVIPVCPRKGECYVLRDKEATIRLKGCDETTFLNADGRSYYLTENDATTLASLKKHQSSLTPSERLTLLRDEWYLVRVAKRKVGDYLDLASSLKGNQERALILEINENLAYVERYLVTPGQRPAFQDWVRQFLQPAAKKMGWKPAPGEEDESRQLRASIYQTLGVTGRDAEVISHAQELAQAYIKDSTAIDPSMATAVVTIAAASGDEKLYDAYVQAYRVAKTPEIRGRFLNALPDFEDPSLVKRTLAFALTPDVRSQDAGRLMQATIRSRNGTDIGFEFLQQQWPQIAARLSPRIAAAVPGSLGASCDSSMSDQVGRFMDEHKVRGAERAVAQARERIANCADFRITQASNLSSWMAERNNLRRAQESVPTR